MSFQDESKKAAPPLKRKGRKGTDLKNSQTECNPDISCSLDAVRKMYEHCIYLELTEENAQKLSDAINFLEIYEDEIRLMRRSIEVKYGSWVMQSYASRVANK